MKRNILIIITIIILALILGIFFYFLDLNDKNARNLISHTNSSINTLTNAFPNNNILVNNTSSANNIQIKEEQKESEISNFSTNLAGDDNRLENIRLSCEKINGIILNNGDTFSFNDIVGEPTSDKGYKEADVIVDTTTQKALGGGNCQVSSTLYNAVLDIDGISIIERNPHKKKVAYVEDGKDASVSYGVLDFKFENNTGNKIKIYMNSEDEKVTARIVSLS